ncbi:aminoglycoside 6-adenylyltransferase [Nocardia pseudobrasiliensis]|uniref:aminoglycoside 6-adenylyltransferase n=1 Tax=Nocardia pseudobrasiliensis TaxID=45979 RepID=UPI001B86E092|nr:aminoglycoside 6-adenylyltransferase [Nocardia pseudobrasiliensis]
MTDNDEVFVARVIDWARSRSDIRAVLRTGSRARGDGRVDALSDHDIELFTSEVDKYAGTDAWVGELGAVAVNIELEGPYDNPAHLVVFADGTKADLQVVPLDLLAEFVEDGLDELHERGYQVLFERDGATAALPAATGAAPRAETPDAARFRAHCAEFWFEIAHLPRYLARGELWVVKSRDWETKELLLTAIEWHALAHFGADHDIWHGGTRMREWTAPGVWERVEAMFAIADPLRQAQAAGDLFAELTREIAAARGFRYPEEIERAIRPQLERLPSR